jgi:hypothetical protein
MIDGRLIPRGKEQLAAPRLPHRILQGFQFIRGFLGRTESGCGAGIKG